MEEQSLTFLVATDVHLGHKEKHPVRNNDSFEAFEEVLQMAKKKKVDFLLLGGDLFDEVNPSHQCIFKCLNILKDQVFGSGRKEVGIEVSYRNKPYPVNFSGTQINISLPIFTIHGNHDYPSNEFGKVSTCDLLQASNYVNYFGKQLNLHGFAVHPLIISKRGSSRKIALYGLGYIKDPILNELFSEGKATFQRPEGDLGQYTCILVIHQNRYKKKFNKGVHYVSSFSPKNIPEWIDLTIWGHEHEAISKVESEYGRNIFQPGSTVLTSFIEAEAIKKQCAIITVDLSDKFRVDSIPLENSYRPMFCLSFEVKVLKQELGETFNLQEFIQNKIGSIVEASMAQCPQKKPIIRLKVEYTGSSDLIRMQQIQVKYGPFVANCEKIVVFWKRKQERPNRISDSELFDNMRKKKIMATDSVPGINDEIGNLIKQSLKDIEFVSIPKEFLMDLTTTMAKETNNIASGCRKKLVEIESARTSKREKKIQEMNEAKELQFKKAMKYQLEKKALIENDKLPVDFTGDREAFLKMEDQVMNSHKFKTFCKIMEESVVPTQSDPSHLKQEAPETVRPSFNQSSRPPAIRKRSPELDSERSSSEDCCERAMKQEMDEDGLKLRFFQAQNKTEEASSRNLKKSSDIKGVPLKIEKKGRNVRFSNDFF